MTCLAFEAELHDGCGRGARPGDFHQFTGKEIVDLSVRQTGRHFSSVTLATRAQILEPSSEWPELTIAFSPFLNGHERRREAMDASSPAVFPITPAPRRRRRYDRRASQRACMAPRRRRRRRRPSSVRRAQGQRGERRWPFVFASCTEGSSPRPPPPRSSSRPRWPQRLANQNGRPKKSEQKGSPPWHHLGPLASCRERP